MHRTLPDRPAPGFRPHPASICGHQTHHLIHHETALLLWQYPRIGPPTSAQSRMIGKLLSFKLRMSDITLVIFFHVDNCAETIPAQAFTFEPKFFETRRSPHHYRKFRCWNGQGSVTMAKSRRNSGFCKARHKPTLPAFISAYLSDWAAIWGSGCRVAIRGFPENMIEGV
jgi:hypothetical protein